MATRVTHIHTKLWTDQYDLWRRLRREEAPGDPRFPCSRRYKGPAPAAFIMTFIDLLILLAVVCRLRREEAPGDPRFSLQHEVAGPRPGRVHHERTRISSKSASSILRCTRRRPRFCGHLPYVVVIVVVVVLVAPNLPK